MRVRTSARLFLACLLTFGTAAAIERDAAACGGCFAPPPTVESNTVVTDHRMILSIGPGKTTLYDQIQYQGSPSSFAWVLPIAGNAEVGLSSNALFQALDSYTQTQVQAPPKNCPPPPQCGTTKNSAAGAPMVSDAGAASDVTVLHEEVVGPYETVQLRSTKPGALSEWLVDHGYAIPPEIEPVIAAYVNEGFDFLALKLVPGASVHQMQPVRVTTAGASPVLPLRMVAAGAGETVGITLWVVGDGRYEPQNFPTFSIKASDLAWTWATNSSNYAALRKQKNDALGGNGWEIESSLELSTYPIKSQVQYAAQYEDSIAASQVPTVDAGGSDASIASDAGPQKSAAELAREDLEVLFAFDSDASFRATRMRSDLGRASLANDLRLSAPPDQSELSNLRVVTRETDEPLCPVYQGCKYVGQAPRSEAQAQSGSFGGGGCSTTGDEQLGSTTLLAGLSIGLATFARARRAKKQARKAP